MAEAAVTCDWGSKTTSGSNRQSGREHGHKKLGCSPESTVAWLWPFHDATRILQRQSSPTRDNALSRSIVDVYLTASPSIFSVKIRWISSKASKWFLVSTSRALCTASCRSCTCWSWMTPSFLLCSRSASQQLSRKGSTHLLVQGLLAAALSQSSIPGCPLPVSVFLLAIYPFLSPISASHP
jgi:hypothetical protein